MKRIANPIDTEELCSYGCGNIAKFVNGSGNLMCQNNSNKCPANRKKNSSGVSKAHEEGRMPVDPFKESRAWRKGKRFVIFEYGAKHKSASLRTALIEERGHRCEECGLSEWRDIPIMLELEHVDGDNKNHIRENLKLLCPNCHSQTETWRGRGRNTGRKEVTDEELLNALIETDFVIKKALDKVHMTPKGTNYNRCYQLIIDYKLMKNAGVAKLVETQET